uniref:Uncharacterized protein n=1 Tax=Panagrolaimus sp. PS1159 TaxID=55785 RepID=A0AC35FFF8_9BILA
KLQVSLNKLLEYGKLNPKGNTDEIYKSLTENNNWQKDLRYDFNEINHLREEVEDLEEYEKLYNDLHTSDKKDKKLRPCSLKDKCVVKLIKRNIPSFFVSCCENCSLLVHRCCKNIDLSCPNCTPFTPTIASGKIHLEEEHNLIYQKIAELTIDIKQREEKFNADAMKLNSGVLTKQLEKVLERYGGSRKAFFQ